MALFWDVAHLPTPCARAEAALAPASCQGPALLTQRDFLRVLTAGAPECSRSLIWEENRKLCHLSIKCLESAVLCGETNVQAETRENL